jgi:hypothetical protein
MKRRGVIGIGLLLVCAGFGPAGSCAKACSKGGSAGDDIARGVGNAGDDLARYRPGRYDPATGRYMPVPIVIPGGALDNAGSLAHLSGSRLDDAVAALPEVSGTTSALARRPSASGVRLTGIDAPTRTFGRDYARALDDLGLRPQQHDYLLDALDVAQDVAIEVIGQLDEGEDEDAEAAGTIAAEDELAEPRRVDPAVKRARVRLAEAAMELDAKLSLRLSSEQLQDLYAALGNAQVIVYRLGRDRPIQDRAPAQ